ncbi:DUF1275 domain-containing protein [Sphingomonas koreensis]|nr:DUF1275 domain-containing protein [Sphingomonas koreensis]
MDRYRPPLIAAAILLAALAGFVDALAYLRLGGFFASFMSGNTTRLGVGFATADHDSARTAGALILSFVCGVMIATIVSVRFARRRKTAVMCAVTLLLALAALTAGMTDRRFPLMLLAVAMGAENGVFSREGEVSIGVTYMTGSLVRFGQKLAAALIGSGRPLGWAPYVLLWLGFAGGVVMGGRAQVAWGGGALWAAAGAAAVLTLVIAALSWRERDEV